MIREIPWSFALLEIACHANLRTGINRSDATLDRSAVVLNPRSAEGLQGPTVQLVRRESLENILSLSSLFTSLLLNNLSSGDDTSDAASGSPLVDSSSPPLPLMRRGSLDIILGIYFTFSTTRAGLTSV